MKRAVLLFILVLALGLHCAAAEYAVGTELTVVKCDEFVSLREEESTSATRLCKVPLGSRVTVLCDDGGKFVYVNYDGQSGYILSQYLQKTATAEGASVSLADWERSNMNEFLTAFTETDLAYYVNGVFDVHTCPDDVLCQFALNHLWYNHPACIEEGDYEDGNNTSASDIYIEDIVRAYFGKIPESLDAVSYEYKDGAYWWKETGGHVKWGFAAVQNCAYLGANRYKVEFGVFGVGEEWSTDEVCAYTYTQAQSAYSVAYKTGSAIVYASNLSDSDSYKLEWLVCY